MRSKDTLGLRLLYSHHLFLENKKNHFEDSITTAIRNVAIEGAERLPSANLFVSMQASSPFCRPIPYLREMSWVIHDFKALAWPQLCKGREITEGTYVHLYDPELGPPSLGEDRPELYGKISKIYGIEKDFVHVGIDVYLSFHNIKNLHSPRNFCDIPSPPHGSQSFERSLATLPLSMFSLPQEHVHVFTKPTGLLFCHRLNNTTGGHHLDVPMRTWEVEPGWTYPFLEGTIQRVLDSQNADIEERENRYKQEGEGWQGTDVD